MTERGTIATVEQTGLGIALVVCAGLIFSLSDSAAKRVVATLDPAQAFWIRSVVVVMLTVPIVVWRQGPAAFRSARPRGQIARGLLVFLASILFLTGLRSLALADATAINFIWPILVTILSVIFLSERVGFRRAGATLAGFAGMLIIMRPGSDSFQAAAIFPLLGAFCWSSASVLTRVLSSDDQAETTIVWSALTTLAAATAMLPFVWRTPTLIELSFAALVGLGSAASHAMIVVAYGRAQASVLASYAYAQLVFAACCGYAFFGTLPDRWVLLGSAIIAGSGLYTIHRERVRRQERASLQS
jgi:drug/metabolite transporter (DMT)-like permease